MAVAQKKRHKFKRPFQKKYKQPGRFEPAIVRIDYSALPADLAPVDAWVVTDLSRPQETFDAVAAQVQADCVLAPALLNISRSDGGGDAAP